MQLETLQTQNVNYYDRVRTDRRFCRPGGRSRRLSAPCSRERQDLPGPCPNTWGITNELGAFEECPSSFDSAKKGLDGMNSHEVP